MEGQLRIEVEILAHVNHKSIIGFYGYFWDKNSIYLILEWASGGELYENMKKQIKNRYQEDKCSKYLFQLIDCFQYLHKMNIIHRDLKPENILISDGFVKLTDFGWATHAPSNKRRTICGTLDCIPPEMVEKKQYDNTVDIWCIGVLAYELCCGRPPFESSRQEQTKEKVKNVIITYPDFFSPLLIDFISKILVKDSSQRMTLKEMKEHPWITKYNNSQQQKL